MLRVLVLQNQPADDGFHHQMLVSSLLLAGGCTVKRAWAITATDDWSRVQPALRPWVLAPGDAIAFEPDVVLLEGDPGLKALPAPVSDDLQRRNVAILHLRATPFAQVNPLREQETDGFARAGFPLARSEWGGAAMLATQPNDYTVRLEQVVFPGGLWTGGAGSLAFDRLETRGLAFILCPEEGGFLPLLTAPLSYEAKDPVWQHGITFGPARKPYCFAGIRWRPLWSALFACDLFSDAALDRADNFRLIAALFTDLLLRKVQRLDRPDHSASLEHWFRTLRGRAASPPFGTASNSP